MTDLSDELRASTGTEPRFVSVNDGEQKGQGREQVLVIGAGPAGLTAACRLAETESFTPVVLEAGNLVGGIARTESHEGFRFDIGGHRFFTKVAEVETFWHEICGEEFLLRPRASRIFYRGKFFDYPLKISNALGNLGPFEAARIVMSYMRWKLFPHREEETFEQWVTNRFGRRLFLHFFKTYTEKVWGIPCSDIRADWAAQRIKNLSLTKALWNALTGANDTASLIEEFRYPRLGPGMMWEMCADRVKALGGEIRMGQRVVGLRLKGSRIASLSVQTADGQTFETDVEQVISTMPLRDLINMMSPPPPQAVRAAAAQLSYRDFLIVTLILDHADPFPDNWIYVHSPSVNVGRIQNFRAWSPDMVPQPDRASIGMEYFCNEGDELWQMDDDELIRLAGRELAKLGLAAEHDVVGGAIIREKKAYPVYDAAYRGALDTIKSWLQTIDNLQTVGRNGLHRYNNQDHSMLTAMLAVRNLQGESHDVWNVNVERSYHEEFQRDRAPTPAA